MGRGKEGNLLGRGRPSGVRNRQREKEWGGPSEIRSEQLKDKISRTDMETKPKGKRAYKSFFKEGKKRRVGRKKTSGRKG